MYTYVRQANNISYIYTYCLQDAIIDGITVTLTQLATHSSWKRTPFWVADNWDNWDKEF